MYEFGGEFVIESYIVPWLIWIQLLITILLVLLLLVGFSLFTGGRPSSSAGGSSSSQSSDENQVPHSKQRIEENQNFKEGLGTSTSREESEGASSVKDASLLRFFGGREHPCHYLGIAKHAFLKCLGLDFIYENSNNNAKHGKED